MNNEEKTKNLISHGGDLAGSAIGGALGFFAGGPILAGVGAAVGTFLGKTFISIGADIHDSYLSPKEEVRIGAATAIALSDINKKLLSGQEIRNDSFYQGSDNKRSDAEDILEGTLLKCKAAYEERKVQHAGKFFSNISFDKEINSQMACYFLQVFEKLTYRQLCLLNVFNRVGNQLRTTSLKGIRTGGELWWILQEIQELKDLNLIYQTDGNQKPTMVWGLGELVPSYLYATTLGISFHKLFDINSINDDELNEIVRLLS